MDGGYTHGREGVRDYWTKQWQILSPIVEPVSFTESTDGSIIVEVQQSIRDLDGKLVTDPSQGLKNKTVGHIFQFRDGEVVRFDIRD